MGLLASLLFGRDAERLFDLVTGESSREREMADQVARSREWCGSTPARAGGPRFRRRRPVAASGVSV